MIEQAIGRFLVLGPIALLALVLSLALMVLLQPWLARYAMARPNARSSHRQPTPQGGGISVVVATFVVAWGAVAASPALLQNEGGQFLALTASAALLAVVGAMDDMRSLSAAVRLAIQCIAVGALIARPPSQLQVLPQLPWWLERAGLFVGAVSVRSSDDSIQRGALLLRPPILVFGAEPLAVRYTLTARRSTL